MERVKCVCVCLHYVYGLVLPWLSQVLDKARVAHPCSAVQMREKICESLAELVILLCFYSFEGREVFHSFILLGMEKKPFCKTERLWVCESGLCQIFYKGLQVWRLPMDCCTERKESSSCSRLHCIDHDNRYLYF